MKDAVLARIEECETVISQIEDTPVWQIVMKDSQMWIDEIDSKWQECNEEQLNRLRIAKMAYIHILNLRTRYKSDLMNAKKSLSEISNEDTVIPKDYDNEGIKEPNEGVGNYGTE